MQPKERTYAGALREFYEETGISLGHSNISYQGYNRLAGDDSKHFAIFLCHVHESFDALLDPEEFTEGGWFSARDLPEPLYPGLLPFIKQHTPMKRETYSPRLCNKPHRLDDGKPIKHKCYVMPTEYLIAEKRGDKARADEIVAGWKKRRRHNGVNG